MSAKPAPKREDALRNSAEVRKAMLSFIKKHQRPPSIQELVVATGLSAKTVKEHRKHVKLGDGTPNIYQQLTTDVLMALHARATGYSHPAVKILSVGGPKGSGSTVERHKYTEHYPPDAAAAKLWVQLVEGFSEKTEQQQSGEVKFTFNYQAPADAGN